MTPSRILPDLQCSLLCEDVRQEVNGNLFIIGVITAVRLPQFPFKVGRLCVFNRWSSGLGQFLESVRVLAPDQSTVLHKSDLKFALRNPAFSATNVTVIEGVVFEKPGTYYIEVLVDDIMKMRFPVPVGAVPPPQQQPSPAPAPTPPAPEATPPQT